jgi:hypothetical protein
MQQALAMLATTINKISVNVTTSSATLKISTNVTKIGIVCNICQHWDNCGALTLAAVHWQGGIVRVAVALQGVVGGAL